MRERHELEQYFWDAPTLQTLADVAARFANPCCLCAPMLGRVLAERAIENRVLDCDERFAADEHYAQFDLYRPQWRDETFGVIICDSPFWKFDDRTTQAVVPTGFQNCEIISVALQ